MDQPRQSTRQVTTGTRKGLVIVNTGEGKGKTTAALGILTRAWGQSMKVVMFQFLKARTGNWGEIRAIRKMGVEIIPLGDGFTWNSEDIEQDKSLAREGWNLCVEKILAPEGIYDIVILDEFTYPLYYEWLVLDDVLAMLDRRPLLRHVIITGQYAPQALIEYADLVTEMRLIKHPYRDQGICAQRGIEY